MVQIVFAVVMVFGILFLFQGYRSLARNKAAPALSAPSIKFTFNGLVSGSFPFHAGMLMCVIGLSLFLLAIYLAAATSLEGNERADFNIRDDGFFISNTYAENTSKKGMEIDKGWVFFGEKENPAVWNFSFLQGDINKLVGSNSSIVLKSLYNVNVRAKYFGVFTGTFLGALSPKTEKLGILNEKSCIIAMNTRVVGFSKVWIDFEKITCPEN